MKEHDTVKIAKAVVPLIILWLEWALAEEKDWRVIKIQSSYYPSEKLSYNQWIAYIFAEIKKGSVKPFEAPY